jgi:hypothetical protein
MAVWSDDTPQDGDDANTLHTLIQACKVDTMDRLRATNVAFDEHDIYDAGATGKHVVSKVGFCGVFATYALLEAAIVAGNAPDGSLHYVSEAANVGLYIIRSGVPEKLGSTDHGALNGLTDDDHTQLILIDGSRAATGDHNIAADPGLSVITWGTDDDNPVPDTHVSESWYVGHGENCLKLRHFADDSVPYGAVNIASWVWGTAGNTRVYIYTTTGSQQVGFWPGVQINTGLAGAVDRNNTYIAIFADGAWGWNWTATDGGSGAKSVPGKKISLISGVG